MIKKINKSEYIVSEWSGGTTSQIAIYPEKSEDKKQNFLWRLSSASIDVETSDFTKLSKYNRYISSLDNQITLNYKNENVELKPLDLFYFDGKEDTKSFGKCNDFNLMLKKKECSATIKLVENIDIINNNLYSENQYLIYCICGDVKININNDMINIKEGETLFISSEETKIDILAKCSKIYYITIQTN